EISALDVWTLAFLFGFQIYFDFCGYSHIALGSAKMIGITFPENFNFPYMASSPKDFWRRWHISLSSWVRDYIYFPLLKIKIHNSSVGGLEKATSNKNDQITLFITWSLMGLWHGANWTFLIWGLYHAFFILIYRLTRPLTNNLKNKNILGWLFTLPIIMLSWIPFRSNSIETSFQMWIKVINPINYSYLGLHENIYIVTLLIALGILITYYVKEKTIKKKLSKNVLFFIGDIVFISFLFYFTFIFLRPINQFIYFQF
ncbi:MBOAT family protein, partial [Candidatus Pelagibacter ubique]|nr:MBOAT family protein [Candidatus Pelagibacter ubique]